MSADPAKSCGPAARARSTRHKVLVVDDLPDNIHVLMDVLRDDYTLAVATNGARALHLATTQPRPDIILLDVVMPDMNGYELCVKLKADPATSAIPIIFLTSLSDEASERKGFDLGAVDFIQKPFSPPLVKARLRIHLELKKHRDRLEDLILERTRELLLTQDAAILGLALLAEYRDTETGDHIRRTQHYVRLMAERLRNHPAFKDYFDSVTMRLLFNSVPLHDIGKVAVPDTILHKPGPLTPDEFELMKQHTQFGREVIRRIETGMRDDAASSFLRFAGELCHSHHERWDGTGYYGLKGDAIPVSGRLMSLADVYDALTTRRAYKPAMSHEQALELIVNGDGRTAPEHFDPLVLQAFLDVEGEVGRICRSFKDGVR